MNHPLAPITNEYHPYWGWGTLALAIVAILWETIKRKNPIDATDIQKEWAEDANESMAYYDIDPYVFLLLTTDKPQTLNDIIKYSESVAWYSSNFMKKKYIVHPFLKITPTGQIVGHEGRHRAAALVKAGEKNYRIALIAEEQSFTYEKYGPRWQRTLPIPEELKSQYVAYYHPIDQSRITRIPRRS